MMNPEHTMHAAQYFTATIHEWRNVLSEDNHKDIIIDNPQFMVNDMKYTAQQLKRSLIKNKSAMLDTFKVDKYDREYQI